MRASLAAALLAAGCSATGVSLDIGPLMRADSLQVTASFDNRKLVRAFGHGGLTMPLTLFAEMPDEDTEVAFVVDAFRDGRVVASGASQVVPLQRYRQPRATITLSGPGVVSGGGGFDLGTPGPATGHDLAAAPDLALPDFAWPPDGLPPAFPVAHVGGGFPAGGDVTVTSSIDTDALTVDGKMFHGSAGAPGGGGDSFTLVGALAVLEVGSLTVAGNVRVSGTHALVVVAARTITIGQGASLDAGARGTTSGPGAAGDGTGNMGTYELPNKQRSSGAGGGGYGIAGAKGGDALTPGGAGGSVYGDGMLSSLVGGSPGGTAGCTPRGGGGGGAIQLTARIAIRLDGNVLAGGGGGQGAPYNGQCGNEGGGGGGAGGAIYVESPTISGAGGLYANGGGGGGGEASYDGSWPGDDGGSACPAKGASGDNTGATNGGNGGCALTAPGDGPASTVGGGSGGGGGATGRIVLHTRCALAAPSTSPLAACLPIY